MNDPDILSVTRPLYKNEIDELGAVNLRDYRLSVGVYLYSRGEIVDLPPSLGRVVSSQRKSGTKDPVYSEPSSCAFLADGVTEPITEH